MNKVGTRQIETERLLLRRFVIEDAEDMYSGWCNDPEVSKYLTWPPHESADVTRYLLNTWIPEYEKGEYFNWVMELKETGKIIGNISYMPEALKAVIDYLFDVAGMNRVVASHDVNNPKSGRVMQKAGMKYEGTLRQAGHNMQGIVDLCYYSVIKSDREQQ